MSDISDLLRADLLRADEFADWLVDIAVRADELMQHPEFIVEIERMLVRWANEYDAQGAKAIFLIPPTPKTIPWHRRRPRRATTLVEKFAAICAIHDVVLSRDKKRIDLWRVGSKRANLQRRKAGIPYAVLCSRVSEITEKDRERLQDVLSDVETHLNERSSAGADETAPSDLKLPKNAGEASPQEIPTLADVKAVVGSDFGTYKQLSGATGLKESQIRSAVRDARPSSPWIKAMHEMPIPNAKQDSPRISFHVEQLWPYLERRCARAQKNS